MQTRRTTAIIGCVVTALVSLTAVPAGAAAPAVNLSRPLIRVQGAAAPATAPGGATVLYSSNWSGYAALPRKAGATFTSIVADYTVPSVNCSVTPDTFSYHWIGLDGWDDQTVEQVGVAADCNRAKPQYAAWYEMYPSAFSFDFPVHPGDAIESTVQYLGNKRYDLALKDVTSGRHFDVIKHCPVASCENSSAEAITEAYYYDKRFAGTSDFGDEHYEGVAVTDSTGQYGGLSNPAAWKTGEGIALGRFGAVDTAPGPLATGHGLAASSAFSVFWSRQD